MVRKKVVRKEISEGRGINFGLIAYIISIVAIVEAFFSPFAGVVLSIIGLSFSKGNLSPLGRKAKTLSIIALIIGIIVLVISILFSYTSLFGSLTA